MQPEEIGGLPVGDIAEERQRERDGRERDEPSVERCTHGDRRGGVWESHGVVLGVKGRATSPSASLRPGFLSSSRSAIPPVCIPPPDGSGK